MAAGVAAIVAGNCLLFCLTGDRDRSGRLEEPLLFCGLTPDKDRGDDDSHLLSSLLFSSVRSLLQSPLPLLLTSSWISESTSIVQEKGMQTCGGVDMW